MSLPSSWGPYTRWRLSLFSYLILSLIWASSQGALRLSLRLRSNSSSVSILGLKIHFLFWIGMFDFMALALWLKVLTYSSVNFLLRTSKLSLSWYLCTQGTGDFWWRGCCWDRDYWLQFHWLRIWFRRSDNLRKRWNPILVVRYS